MKNTTFKVIILTTCVIVTAVAFSASAVTVGSITVSAGPDLYVTSGSFNSHPSAILQGSASDSNGGALNYNWSCNGGSVNVYNALQPLFTAPNNVWQKTSYVCTLTATDGYGISASDSAIIYVNNDFNNQNETLGIQTNSATNNNSGQAVLNGTVSGGNNVTGIVYVWFQWGTATSYGSESAHRPVGYMGPFDQHVAGLMPNTTYHFRATAQRGTNEAIFGQDMTFTTPSYQYAGYTGGGLVAGATTVATGLTNNFLVDSFFFPLLIILAGLWLAISGQAG